MVKKIIEKQNKISKNYTFAVGRRREAVARVRLYNPTSGKVDMFENEYNRGDIIVNGKPVGEYFRFAAYMPAVKKFFDETGAREKYIFLVKIVGGGASGQLDAMLHGLARVLDKIDKESYHTVLKKNGYLTRDARTRERRKVGNAGKARRKKSSPKR